MPAYRRERHTREDGWISNCVSIFSEGGHKFWFNRADDKKVGAIESYIGEKRYFWNTSVSRLTWAEFMAERKLEIRVKRYAGLL